MAPTIAAHLLAFWFDELYGTWRSRRSKTSSPWRTAQSLSSRRMRRTDFAGPCDSSRERRLPSPKHVRASGHHVSGPSPWHPCDPLARGRV